MELFMQLHMRPSPHQTHMFDGPTSVAHCHDDCLKFEPKLAISSESFNFYSKINFKQQIKM